MSADLLTPLWRPDAAMPDLDAGGWERLLRQARLGALVPRVAMRFDAHGGLDRVPAGPRQHLENGMRLAARQVQAVRWEVERIRRAVAPTGTPVVLLKGAAYLLAGLPAAQGRLFADIDILVPRDRLEIVELALLGAGWVSRERDRYNQRYYRVWMHELPPLEHVKRSTVIDVHHTITPPTSSFNVDGQLLLSQSRALPGHDGLAVLQPVDMLLHSMVHLFQEGDFDHGLRDLIDMHALLLHFEAQDAGFWPQLTARARQLGLGVPLVQALDQLQRLFEVRIPAAVAGEVADLHPHPLRRRLMYRAVGRALTPAAPECHRPGDGLLRWLLYVRSHWLRMPLHLLVPHLVRKAWMRHFPDKPGDAAGA